MTTIKSTLILSFIAGFSLSLSGCGIETPSACDLLNIPELACTLAKF